MKKRQPQFESDSDRTRLVNRFTWFEFLKLLVFWAVSWSLIMWIAFKGAEGNW